jgi:hypothetical protein
MSRVAKPKLFKIRTALYRFFCAKIIVQGGKAVKKEAETISRLVKKRRDLWQRHKDINEDKELCSAIADKILDTEGLRKAVLESPELLIEACFTITDKNGKTVPFFFNEVQSDFVRQIQTQGRQKPYFILKGRQQGFTTLITAIMLSYCIVKRNFSGFIVADRGDNTKSIFNDKAKSMYNSLPKRLQPTEKFNSSRELYFDKLNSSLRVATASSNIGRSRTLSFIHYSEVAFYKCPLADLQKSIAEAATKDALCIYETTANGFNEARTLWESGACINLFYEWYKNKEYTSCDYEALNTSDAWLKSRLLALEKRGLDKGQLAWYAKKYHSYIDKSAIRQEYPISPEEAFVTSGECVFDTERISNHLASLDVKAKTGYFTYTLKPQPIYSPGGELVSYKKVITNINFVESNTGYISIVEEPRSKKQGHITFSCPYVIGADTAGSGEDYFTAKVLDNTNGKCVATLHIKNIDEDLFAHQLYCLGTFYHTALIGVEINYSAHPVRVLCELGYKNIYARRQVASDSKELEYGFLTTSLTRPLIISNLVSLMREKIELETDRKTLLEMTTFVKKPNGRPSALDGSHDDLVMASAIAHYIAEGYTHKEIISDNSSEFLNSNFSQPYLQKETYMEW